MSLSELGLTGKWLVANCGDFPSDKNCKLIMMAPEHQRADLVEAGIAHAIKSHGHAESEIQELRKGMDSIIKTIEA